MLSREDLLEAPCSRRLPRSVVQRYCSTLVGLTSGRLVSSKKVMIADGFALVMLCLNQPRALNNRSGLRNSPAAAFRDTMGIGSNTALRL